MFLVWLIPCLAMGLLIIILFLSIFRIDFRRKKVKFDRASITGAYVSSQLRDVSAAFGHKDKHSHDHHSTGNHNAHHVGQHHGSGTDMGHHHSHGGGDFGGGHFGGIHY